MTYTTPIYTNFENVILTLLALLVIIIFGGALYAFVSAIFLFIFSKGNPEKIKKAINSLRYMILGILLSLFLLMGFPFIAEKTRIPGYKVYTAKNIFKKASGIIKGLFYTISGQTFNSGKYDTTDTSPNNDIDLDTSL